MGTIIEPRDLCNFMFFKNTPLNDMSNTIHFESNEDRDNFFISNPHYETIDMNNIDFNYIRDRSSLNIQYDYFSFKGVNYCTFYSKSESFRYYAYVISYEYVNNKIIRVNLIIDTVMTYTQGSVLNSVNNVNIKRQHFTRASYNANLEMLRNNSDILDVTTRRYQKQQFYKLDGNIILFQTSIDLESDFGTLEYPLLNTSSGTVFDNLTAPTNIYMTDYVNFNGLMSRLSSYSWIVQTFRDITLIPDNFIIREDFETIEFKNFTWNYVYKPKKYAQPMNNFLISELSFNFNHLMDIHNFDVNEDKHLIRNHYFTAELYGWNGQSVAIDISKLDREKCDVYAQCCFGYHNELTFFINQYKSDDNYEQPILDSDNKPIMFQGSYLNDCISFKNFDNIPIMVDNYSLALANNANQTRLAESKLLSNRVESVLNPNANIADRIMNAISLTSNLSVGGLMNVVNDEYEFYRTQKAKNADLALTAPSITNQTNNNSFNIANNNWGVSLKISSPSNMEWDNIKNYYKSFGYEMNSYMDTPENIHSMTICNYLQFDGQWTLNNIDPNLMELLRAQISNGIRFWHNNNTNNPMRQPIKFNVMRI